MVKTLNFQDKGCSMIPGWGIKIPRALRWGQKRKKRSEIVHMEGRACVLEILRMCIQDVNGWRWRVKRG